MGSPGKRFPGNRWLLLLKRCLRDKLRHGIKVAEVHVQAASAAQSVGVKIVFNRAFLRQECPASIPLVHPLDDASPDLGLGRHLAIQEVKLPQPERREPIGPGRHAAASKRQQDQLPLFLKFRKGRYARVVTVKNPRYSPQELHIIRSLDDDQGWVFRAPCRICWRRPLLLLLLLLMMMMNGHQ
jgi:hypothetical protein